MVKIKCKCGHGKDVHLLDSEPSTECCVIYRGPDGELKSCSCTKFEEDKGNIPQPKPLYSI